MTPANKALPREVSNRMTGERIVLTQTAAETGGQAVVFDLFLKPSGGVDFEHYHGHQTEIFRMKRGELSVKIAGESRVLRAGETLELEPGVVHSLRNESTEEIECEVEYRPALRSDWWLMNAHAASDHLGRELTLLELAPHLAQGIGIYPAGVPRWLLDALLAPLSFVSRALGKHKIMLEAAEAWHAAGPPAASSVPLPPP